MNLLRNLFKNKTNDYFDAYRRIIKLFPVLLLIALNNNANAQSNSHTYSGIIINENNELLSSVTITVKSTGKSVLSNEKGHFAISNVPQNSVLRFSCVGYEPREISTTTLNDGAHIILNSITKQLPEVEVYSSGYQQIPKERATGSFIRIDNSTLNQQAGTDILKRLNNVTSSLLFNIGKSNLNPQNTTNISIRGLSTIKGPLDPLIILNGFIYEGQIENINPNDVEEITILKDAAATSIWGARAGNGVIVINTKKGKYNQKFSINASANAIISEKSNLYYLPQIKSADYINLEEILFKSGYFDKQINLKYSPLTPAVEIFVNRRKGLISFEDSVALINELKSIDSRDEYLREFYTVPVTQQYSMNITGGGDNSNYSTTVSIDRKIDETYNAYRKINVRLDYNVKLGKRISLNYGGYFTNRINKSGRPTYNSFKIGAREVPYLKFRDENGSPLIMSNLYAAAYIDTAGNGKLLDWHFYPTENYKHEKTEVSTSEIFTYTGINIKVASLINLDLKYQYQNQGIQTETIRDVESFNARNQINLFSQLNRSTGIVNYVIPVGGIREAGNSAVRSQTLRGQLNFHNNNKRNSINAILGIETRESTSKSENNIVYGYQEDPLTFTKVDFVNYYRNFITGGFSSIPFSRSFSHKIDRFVSFYSNVAYTFDKKYTITASARRDGSNIFGASTNDKWSPLWSTGILWNISSEKFYKISVLPQLRTRITYGYSGNVDLGKSAVAIGRYFSPSSNTNLPYARITTLNNPMLRWEKTAQFNVGIDFTLRNSIISGSIEFYHKKGVDLYGQAPYDYTTWGYLNQFTRNVAEMTGNGIDIMINTKNLNTKLKWVSIILFNYNNNKTTKYDSEIEQSISSKLGEGRTISPFIGKPLYSIAGFTWGGLDVNGNPQGYVNGELSTDYQSIFEKAEFEGTNSSSIKFIGSASPTVFGSVINTFSLQNFSVNVNISYRLGYFFRKTTISYSDLIQSGWGHSDFEKRWQKPGDERLTSVPSFEYPANSNRDFFYTNSEKNILSADNVKLEYISINYNNHIKRIGLKSIELFLNISNLGIIWRKNDQKIDPDYPSSIRPPKTVAVGTRISL